MRTIITLAILCPILIYSQASNDSIKTKTQAQVREQIQQKNSEMQSVKEQIGPKSNSEAAGNPDRKKKDVFIDKDGDGICDSRQSGMSFNKLRQRFGAGKNGPGKVGHGSGSGNQNGSGSGN